jgi:hypothetical protein
MHPDNFIDGVDGDGRKKFWWAAWTGLYRESEQPCRELILKLKRHGLIVPPQLKEKRMAA